MKYIHAEYSGPLNGTVHVPGSKKQLAGFACRSLFG